MSRPETARQEFSPLDSARATSGPHEREDSLSDVLDGLRARCRVLRGASSREPWSIELEDGPPTFFAVATGRACFRSRGEEVLAGPGELLLFPGSSCAPLAGSTRAVRCTDSTLPGAWRQELPDGTGTCLLAGSLFFEDGELPGLGDLLPEVLRVPALDARFASGVDDVLRILEHALDEDRSGSRYLLEHGALMLFVYALRTHLERAPAPRSPWLRALASPDLGAVLGALHRRPERPWTVAMMARRAGLSRTVFAQRFLGTVGSTPVRYLLECRMQRALALIHDGHSSMKEIATRVGYGSEAAFSHAFKRWNGRAPTAYLLRPGQPPRSAGAGRARRSGHGGVPGPPGPESPE